MWLFFAQFDIEKRTFSVRSIVDCPVSLGFITASKIDNRLRCEDRHGFGGDLQ
jgi:hypothetical protein